MIEDLWLHLLQCTKYLMDLHGFLVFQLRTGVKLKHPMLGERVNVHLNYVHDRLTHIYFFKGRFRVYLPYRIPHSVWYARKLNFSQSLRLEDFHSSQYFLSFYSSFIFIKINETFIRRERERENKKISVLTHTHNGATEAEIKY